MRLLETHFEMVYLHQPLVEFCSPARGKRPGVAKGWGRGMRVILASLRHARESSCIIITRARANRGRGE